MRLLYFALITLLFFSCNSTETNRSKLIDFVPENTSAIIKSNNIEGLKSSINNSDFLQKISNTNSYKSLEDKLENLTYLNPASDILICFSKDINDSLQYSIITKNHQGLFITDSLPNYIEESLKYKNKTITKSTINKSTFYSTVLDSTFFASSSKDVVDGIFNNSELDFELEKIYSTINDDKTFSIILKPNNPFAKSFFIADSLTLNTFTEYIAADVDISQNSIIVNGVTKASDSTKSLINIFKNTVPQENQIQNITPSNSDGFLSFTFDDFKTFEGNLGKFQKKDTILNASTLFNDVIEVGVIYEDENRAIALNSIDIIATKDALIGEQSKIDSYREIDIYSFSNSNLFKDTFYPLITFDKATMYCVLDNFFVFCNDNEMLQNIIANYQNETTLGNKDYFENIKNQLSDASSLIQVTNASTLSTVINKNLDSDNNLKLSDYNTSAIQFVYDVNFAHVNAVIKKNASRTSLNSVSEVLNIKLDKDLLNNPQFVKNHITNEKEIVVQDINNNLYLISNTGKILWKKTLQGPVLGNIEQIDIYKNGRLQLAFATPNRIYVIDKNGNDVAPFPARFNDDITQPLSVFDYDKNKNYRLLVTQGKNVLMYNVKAQIVNGFTFKSANNNIICQPKHFRIGSKDYITFKTENKLYILDRTGRTRVSPKTQSTYSSQPIFLYNNAFTTTSSGGDLIMVDSKGNVSSRNLNLSEKHFIDTSSKTLVTLTENQLSIKNRTNELDFGDYTSCKLFYINDKIYVTVTDLQSHKVYLFDSQSKPIPNFPVYGNSTIDLDNIDRDNKLEFVTKGESNSVILYQIN
ncbi:ribonuclease HII [Sabulilitoribacter multivorans]|uniref:Ribonuclease HII n=1 Tax=Flaviramulus multivorans TaxID=1304750 RepID=A0ABS9IK35_9FLAO|nr:ribonuclease HII [Flaviramulus multivorans]MCF7560956.1 ribonuclease HII [Flaviramulus multivorans]